MHCVMDERPETELISIPATPRASTPEILTPSGQRSPRAAAKEAASKSWTPTSFISPRFLSPIGTPMKRVLINMKGYLEEVGHLTKLNPQDAWLPITESRNGNAYYAAFHNLNAGVGFQALVLPVAFSFLGWSWGIISLTVAYFWQLYTLWILVQLHEAVPGKRYNRYVELAQAAFGESIGERLGVWLALFPTVYLSAGTATALILVGGETMKLFFHIVCGPLCSSNPLTTVEWYLVFTSLCIVLSQLPNLNSIAGLSLVGAVTAITYSTMVWVLSVSQPRPPPLSYQPLSMPTVTASIFSVLNALGIIAQLCRRLSRNLLMCRCGVEQRLPISLSRCACSLLPLEVIGLMETLCLRRNAQRVIRISQPRHPKGTSRRDVSSCRLQLLEQLPNILDARFRQF
ncbi:hypothetical protein DH2020_008138 [Rehmannia glutinosa]|uniref:Amino acid transporter transmembrane domain-containing protein n=1 Tax=Rehmannia glutinosa TaxID=99300 RepID=A0ABR0U061_REHGL